MLRLAINWLANLKLGERSEPTPPPSRRDHRRRLQGIAGGEFYAIWLHFPRQKYDKGRPKRSRFTQVCFFINKQGYSKVRRSVSDCYYMCVPFPVRGSVTYVYFVIPGIAAVHTRTAGKINSIHGQGGLESRRSFSIRYVANRGFVACIRLRTNARLH